ETKIGEHIFSATSHRFCPFGARLPIGPPVPVVISALKPILRSPSSVCNRNYLDTLVEHPVDDEEGEPTQQKASGVADIRRRGFRSLRNQPYGSIELAAENGVPRSRFA